jgi:uncharacterized damage-inducible protein DinB
MLTLGKIFAADILAEAPASRNCLERIPAELFNYSPHEKSMKMGYLALLVAEVPKWIAYTLEKGDIDFATFSHTQCKNGEELAKHLDENMIWAKKLLETVTDEELETNFNLSSGGKVLMSMSKKDMISSSIRHWVHHRGQLTVYMRLNNIPVPSIYGPTADENTFK